MPHLTPTPSPSITLDAHISVKAAARLVSRAGPLTGDERISLCARLLRDDPEALRLTNWESTFPKITRAERHYRISALYMLLMPAARRQRLAAYFTPPHLCDHVFARLTHHGFNAEHDSILDPASGGAAFLVPAAERILNLHRLKGTPARQILESARSLLTGIEIEPGLARLSELLLSDVFRNELRRDPSKTLGVVDRSNSLKLAESSLTHDVVVSNPPYGRVFRASDKFLKRWASVITEGHVNTYSVFISLALEQVKNGGLVAVIVPTSFLSGPYFGRLREHIIENSSVLELNVIEKRSDVFLDVVQDTCVLVLRKHKVGDRPALPGVTTCMAVSAIGSTRHLGLVELPDKGSRAWGLPSTSPSDDSSLFPETPSNLLSYGYSVKTGYFVWNRSKARLSDRLKPRRDEVPLVWAHNIKSAGTISLAARPRKPPLKKGVISFVKVDPDSSAVQRQPAIVLQRTTNRSQPRRLIAGLLPRSIVRTYGGFVTENHTLVVTQIPGTKPKIPLTTLLGVLNSSAVDARYRRVSGTVSISTRVLRELSLPDADTLIQILKEGHSIEVAVTRAYKVFT